MTQLFIQLVQSVAGAVAFMVALLLVSAIIGYFSAWFYAKSVYTPIIKGLEAEKAELNNQVLSLKNEINTLNGKIESLNQRIVLLDKEIVGKNKEIKELGKPKK